MSKPAVGINNLSKFYISGIGYLSPFKYVDMKMIHRAYNLGIWRLAYFSAFILFLGLLSWHL